MRRVRDASIDPAFVARVRQCEERLFPDGLHPDASGRMRSDGYSWLYRPSHHASTGLVTAADVASLSKPGKRLLSVGGHPGYLERVLAELGVPVGHIVAADALPAIVEADLPFGVACFDMLEPWPDLGTFDLIVFPESLCIALADRLKKAGPHGDAPFSTDAHEARLLAHVLEEALRKLNPDGEIRANGPQSHPNVVKEAQKIVDTRGCVRAIEYQRYFLRVAG